jgi:hypothetical protein
MISPLSITDKYIIQPTLLDKHKKTLEWLSASVFWKRELAFFQKLLDQYAPRFTSEEDKKKIDHFQNIIIYYKGELIDSLAGKLRQHEKQLAHLLEKHDEASTNYYSEHLQLISELESLEKQFNRYKEELFAFVEQVM